MPTLAIEVPSIGFSDEQKEYLVRQLVRINIAFGQVNRFEPRSTLPAKYSAGDVYYFAAAIPATSITGEGLWLRKTSAWVQLG